MYICHVYPPMNDPLLSILRCELSSIIEDLLRPHFHQINHKLELIIMAETDLADALVAQEQATRDAVASAAQRILDAITAAVQASDVSPKLQAALDAGQANIDAINALAPSTPTP